MQKLAHDSNYTVESKKIGYGFLYIFPITTHFTRLLLMYASFLTHMNFKQCNMLLLMIQEAINTVPTHIKLKPVLKSRMYENRGKVAKLIGLKVR